MKLDKAKAFSAMNADQDDEELDEDQKFLNDAAKEEKKTL